MFSRIPFNVGPAMAVLCLAQCWPGSSAAQPKVEGALIVAEDGTATVTLERGKELVLKLRTQAGTGYLWRIAKNYDKVLEPAGKEPTLEKADKSKRVGGQLLSVFRFQGVTAGSSDLELEYVRPFEKDVKPAKTFKAAVTVVDAPP